MRRILRETVIDIGWGILWAAVLIAVVLFSSGASQFIYVDF